MKRKKRKLIIAWILLGVIALVFNRLIPTHAEEKLQVLVAQKHIPAGVTIHETMVKRELISLAAATPDVFIQVEDVVGLRATYDILPGEQIIAQKVNSDGIQQKTYLFTFPIKSLADGQVQVGDVVPIWVDYDQKRFPEKKPEQLLEKAVVVTKLDERNNELRDNRGVPRFISIEVSSTQEIAYLREKMNQGSLFPVPPSTTGGGK